MLFTPYYRQHQIDETNDDATVCSDHSQQPEPWERYWRSLLNPTINVLACLRSKRSGRKFRNVNLSTC